MSQVENLLKLRTEYQAHQIEAHGGAIDDRCQICEDFAVEIMAKRWNLTQDAKSAPPFPQSPEPKSTS